MVAATQESMPPLSNATTSFLVISCRGVIPLYKPIPPSARMEMIRFEKWIVNSVVWNWVYRKLILDPFLSKLSAFQPHGKALELGCGAGYTSRVILNHFSHLKLTALDYDSEQVVQAQRRLRGTSIKVLQGDATHLKYSSNSFDCIFEFNAFHHIKEYQKAIRECYCVLKKGGYFYLVDASTYFFHFRWITPVEASFTRDQFVAELEQVGFTLHYVSPNQHMFRLVAQK